MQPLTRSRPRPRFFGTSGPSFALDFVNGTNALDPRVTFTRASTATYFDASGTLRSAQANVPRIDYNPATLAAQGLLIEESRTNGLRYSEAFMTQALTVTGVSGTFSNGETVTATGGGTGTYISADSTATVYAIYNGTGTFSGTLTGGTSGATATISSSQTNGAITRASIVPDAAIAPNGLMVAEKLVEDTTATNTHAYQQNTASVTSGTTYALSIFAKAAERTWAFFLTSGVPFGANGVYVNLTNGALGSTSGSPLTTSVQNCGNGWYRITVTITAISTGSAGWALRLATADNVSSYTGDGTSGLFIWGAQLEAGAFPTSYIPTTTTALTRAADVASVNTLSPWYNASQGTLYVEFTPVGAFVNARVSVSLNDGSSANFMYVGTRNGSATYGANNRISSGTIVAIGSFGAANTSTQKAAFAYDGAGQAVTFNSSAVATATEAIPAVTTMTFSGITAVTASQYLRRISYYPRKLSNAELQAITT